MPDSVSHGLSAAWHALWSFAPYGFFALLWLLLAAHVSCRRYRRMTPADKAALLRRAPRLAGLMDFLLMANMDGAWAGRAIRTMALGSRAPGVIATLDMLEHDPDADGITLTHGTSLLGRIPSMPPLALSPATVYPPPPAELATRPEMSDRYVIVRSDRPPALSPRETERNP